MIWIRTSRSRRSIPQETPVAADLTGGGQLVAADFVPSQQRGSVAGTAPPFPSRSY